VLIQQGVAEREIKKKQKKNTQLFFKEEVAKKNVHAINQGSEVSATRRQGEGASDQDLFFFLFFPFFLFFLFLPSFEVVSPLATRRGGASVAGSTAEGAAGS
jgi:hypothetical protein